MIPENFAIFGAFIASLGGFYYLYETLAGKTKPNRVTWLLWGIFPLIAFVAQRSQGINGLAWVTFVSGFTPLLVFCASFVNKKAYWKTTKLDYICMLLAIVGIVLWITTKNANLAILFAIFADFCAATPTIIKCYKHPGTESWVAYAISTLGFGFSILAIQTWSIQSSAFVIYLTFINGIMAIFASKAIKTSNL